MVGGSSDPSVPRSPGVTLQEGRAARGAPPPRGDKSSETLLVLCLVSVRFLWDRCWAFCLVLLVSGVGMCLACRPLGPDPMYAQMFVVPSLSFSLSLSLSLSLFCVRYFRRRSFLFFSLSQMLGKPVRRALRNRGRPISE